MTFTEAAIEVLRREGKPLHFKKIAEIAAREDLLDHVGKIPEETMAGQLVAHCRLPKADRRLIAVQHGTFALAEWGLDEDPAGIENLVEEPPVDEVPYRGRERHPIPSRDVARASGRGEGRRRREEGEERRAKRFPPPSEVAYEILAGAGKALSVVEIASQGAERLLMPEAFVRDVGSLRAALLEDNRRRESGGRKPLFDIDGETVTLGAQPEPGERTVAAGPRAVAGGADLRKAAVAALRRRLRECDGPTFEHLAVVLLERLGFTELKVVKRGREHAVYTGRRRLGAADVRHAIRVIRAHADVTRRDVQDLRRDVPNYGAQMGVVVATGDLQREARGDASAAGQLPILLYCGEALAEAAAETSTACRAVVVPEIDEAFFREAASKGAEEESARRARREERERRDGRRQETPRPAEVVVGAEPSDGTPEAEGPPEIEPAGEGLPSIIEVRATIDDGPGSASDAEDGDGDEEDGPDEGDEGDEERPAQGAVAEGAPTTGGAPGEEGEGRRRRRRRRRRRGGRGRREGAPGATAVGPPAGGEAASGPPAATGGEPASPPTERAEPAPAEPPPASGGGEPSGG